VLEPAYRIAHESDTVRCPDRVPRFSGQPVFAGSSTSRSRNRAPRTTKPSSLDLLSTSHACGSTPWSFLPGVLLMSMDDFCPLGAFLREPQVLLLFSPARDATHLASALTP